MARTQLKIVDPQQPCGATGAGSCDTCAARDLSVCAAASQAGRAQLESLSEKIAIEPGEVLFRQGDSARHVFNITRGAVRLLCVMADGRRQIIGFLFPGDFLGLTGETYAFSAEALEPTACCRFTRADYLRIAASHPELEGALLSRFSTDLAAAQNHVLLLGRKTARERLASFLLDLESRAVRRGELPGLAKLSMTRGDIADYLGLTLETVSRVLSSLKDKGVIRQTSSRSYAILKPDVLKAAAGE